MPVTTGMPTVYVGAHHPHWVARTDLPLFISHRRLAGRRTLPAARTDWALDSGGFTELSLHGRWVTSPAEYVTAVARYQTEIGRMRWAAPQDWMCEPHMIERTGLSVPEHQHRTVTNYQTLQRLWADRTDAPSPFAPVLQGWTLADYLDCWDMYTAAGIDLTQHPIVGIGSVCRRQHTEQIGDILTALHQRAPLRLHGFGVKTQGLARYGHLLTSADSMAWSYAARRQPPLDGCTTHINCANCLHYATRWHRQITSMRITPPAIQLGLFGGAA